LVVAAAIGVALGVSMGERQGGPLAGQGAGSGRPTIVVAGASVSPSVAASPAASPAVAATTPTPTSASVEYVVQPGDTLQTIARDQYGDAGMWRRIYDANRDAIGPDPDALRPGTKLQLPQ
jgi:nucleoid-associated protein YgaU